MVTFEEELRAEGRAEGKARAKKEVAINMFKRGFALDMVAQLTSLEKDLLLTLKEQVDKGQF